MKRIVAALAMAAALSAVLVGFGSSASATEQDIQGECNQEADCPSAEIGAPCSIDGREGTIVSKYYYDGQWWYVCSCPEPEPTTTTTSTTIAETTTTTAPPTTQPPTTQPPTTVLVPGPQGPQGPAGPVGPAGPQGPSGVVTVAQPARPVVATPSFTG